ncbi:MULTISPECIES: proline racemase family protein [unclassified Paraburkholderia]|uniref:proline racemase family protein n=1 Tax=unclassified Paraburkholderia TaxID=2615204 RepID=UPI002AAF9C19|nr:MULTISPECIES: proline racemase family protein [unclassified Paraburkholderia]
MERDVKGRRYLIDLLDIHVGGDVHRIVLGGIKELPGSSVAEKMHYLRDEADGLRQLLLLEPRGGHPSLYADLVVSPTDKDADAGYIIMEVMGYPAVSGTNTMSTAVALLESGRVSMKEGLNRLLLEAPGGLVEIMALCESGRVKTVQYRANTPSFVYARDQSISVPGWGDVSFDLIWTGAFYPVVDATAFGFGLHRNEEQKLVEFSKAFLLEARKHFKPMHPEFGDEGPLSFVVFAGTSEEESPDLRSIRTSCYVYPSDTVCRAPAGVPSTAVLLKLVDRGVLEVGASLRTISIFDTELMVTADELNPYADYVGLRATVKGRAFVISRSQVVVDFDDPLTPRAGLENILNRPL